jgi:spore maturation protein SpmA
MINSVWLFLIISGIAVAAARGTMGDVSAGIMAGASSSVELFLFKNNSSG